MDNTEKENKKVEQPKYRVREVTRADGSVVYYPEKLWAYPKPDGFFVVNYSSISGGSSYPSLEGAVDAINRSKGEEKVSERIIIDF